MEVGIEPIGEMVLLAMENAPRRPHRSSLPEKQGEDNIGRVQAVGPEAKSVAVGTGHLQAVQWYEDGVDGNDTS